MNNKMVEMTLKRIVEIDETAVEVKNKIKAIEEVREKDLKKLFRKMEFEVMRSARKEAKTKYNIVLEEAKAIEENINNAKDKEEEDLKKVIETHREKLVEELFQELFLKSAKS